MSASALSELCTSCARCCNGRLFRATQLTADEQWVFGCAELPQPCPQLGADLRCAVYATRPAACRAYLCPAAAALERGELTLEQARTALPG